MLDLVDVTVGDNARLDLVVAGDDGQRGGDERLLKREHQPPLPRLHPQHLSAHPLPRQPSRFQTAPALTLSPGS
eukprot:2175374-Rhodomonas_salina.1